MPINPLIASGGTPFDVSNALFKMGDGQRQDRAVQVAEERNALVDRRWQAQDQREQNALAKQTEQDALLDQLADEFDAINQSQGFEAAKPVLSKIGRLSPDMANLLIKVNQGESASAPGSYQEFSLASENPSYAAFLERRRQPAGGGGAIEAPAGQREREWFLSLPPEQQQQVLNYNRGNATPEIARATAEATATGRADAERQAAIEKKLSSANTMGDALDIATTLIPIATGSGVGAMADRVAGVFGYTLTGAEATASLRVLASKVLENVPRMEGPQSDKDVQMYKEAAGQLGDPAVTRAEKMAAIRTIRRLSATYASRNAGQAVPAAPPSGGSRRMRFDANGNAIP